SAKEDAEGDSERVPQEQEADSGDGDDRRGEGSVPEEQPEPPVDEQHASCRGEQGSQVQCAHRYRASVAAGSRAAGGPALWSPRIRLSTSWALMRHMGRPTPGAVVAPA